MSLPPSVARAAESTGAVYCSHLTDPGEYLSTVTRALERTPTSVLSAVEGQVAELVRGSYVITCAAGDTLVRCHGTAHTLYVILSGASTDGRTDGAALGRSEALRLPAEPEDVTIASDGTQVLALSERSLRGLADGPRDALTEAITSQRT